MTKVTRTYLSGCSWCNATGISKGTSLSTDASTICPVCRGSKVITVTEEYDALYEIDCSKLEPYLGRVVVSSILHEVDKIRTLHEQLKEAEFNAWKDYYAKNKSK